MSIGEVKKLKGKEMEDINVMDIQITYPIQRQQREPRKSEKK